MSNKITGMGAISPSEAATKYGIQVPNAVEAIFQPLYDRQTYKAAGQNSLTFFQNPKGANGKTLADTNLVAAGTIPSPQRFLLQGLAVSFYPGADQSTIGTAAANDYINDYQKFIENGSLTLTMLSKNYLEIAPLAEVTIDRNLHVQGTSSDSSTAAIDRSVQSVSAYTTTEIFQVTPKLFTPNANFAVDMNWPTVVPLSSDAVVRVALLGTLYRQAQ